MHVASLTWFSRLCINTSTEKYLSSESSISVVGQLFKEVLYVETKYTTTTSTSGSNPVFGATQGKHFHGIVLHILEGSVHLTLTFSPALCPQQLQKPTQLYFEKLKVIKPYILFPCHCWLLTCYGVCFVVIYTLCCGLNCVSLKFIC